MCGGAYSDIRLREEAARASGSGKCSISIWAIDHSVLERCCASHSAVILGIEDKAIASHSGASSNCRPDTAQAVLAMSCAAKEGVIRLRDYADIA